MIKDGLQNENIMDISSFLMIGQSNMAGRGEIGEVEKIVNNQCHMLRNGRWQLMAEPINPDRPIFDVEFRSGTNLCASFADMYSKHFNKKIGLIPCADGGTRVADWMPGQLLYDNAVFNTKLAMRTSKLSGILWHQGESDCNAVDILLYKERFISMITQLRADLNAENVPVIIGEISENITERWDRSEYLPIMNSIFHEIKKEIPLCDVVSSKGLELKPDGIHFNSKSLREFGRRYFDTYLSLLG